LKPLILVKLPQINCKSSSIISSSLALKTYFVHMDLGNYNVEQGSFIEGFTLLKNDFYFKIMN